MNLPEIADRLLRFAARRRTDPIRWYWFGASMAFTGLGLAVLLFQAKPTEPRDLVISGASILALVISHWLLEPTLLRWRVEASARRDSRRYMRSVTRAMKKAMRAKNWRKP